jgi:hypothetical protein
LPWAMSAMWGGAPGWRSPSPRRVRWRVHPFLGLFIPRRADSRW